MVQGPTLVLPEIQEVEIGRITVWGQPKENISKSPSQPISQAWQYKLVVPTMQEV
jgi:hypothetical protein